MNIFKRKTSTRVASPVRFRRLVAAERRRQLEKGYTAEHDAQHGPLHLLALSQIYGRLGEPIKAAALTEAAMDLIRGAGVQYVDIVFTGTHPANRVFSEVEDPDGASLKFGTWVQREDGYAALRVNYWDAVAALRIPGVQG